MNHVHAQIVFDSFQFQCWKKKVESNGVSIENINVLAVVRRDPNTLIAAMLDCQMVTPEGDKIPRCVVIRGECVGVIPLLNCIDDGATYTLVVEQRRIVDGGFSLEFAGGGIDLSEDTPLSVAVKEVEEELGITVSEEELHSLAKKPIVVCESMFDQVIYFFYFEREVTRAFLDKIDGQNTGCHKEKEFIKVRVKKIEELCSNPSFSSLSGIKLLEKKLNRTF